MRELFHGVVNLIEKDGYTIPRRFTFSQEKVLEENSFFLDRVRCSASVTLELDTDAEKVGFDYKFFLRTGVDSTFEVYTDGFLTHLIKDNELTDEGILSFSFKQGKKHIEIYLPNYSEVGVKNFFADGAYEPIPFKDTKVLFIGDSITQGGGPKRTGCAYVNVTKRALNYEVLNWGIGGYPFDEKIIQFSPFQPHKIVVAMGTNNRFYAYDKNEKDIGAFFEKLNATYSHIPVLVLLPPWDGSVGEEVCKNYRAIKVLIETNVTKYPQMQIASAYDMIPHFSDYFMEDLVHPSPLGMETYGNNLVKAIMQRGF